MGAGLGSSARTMASGGISSIKQSPLIARRPQSAADDLRFGIASAALHLTFGD
jgi:hypothetical protein